jgi:hypothetical protein
MSSLALFVSGITAWLTFFRKGALKATQPTTVYLGLDGINDPSVSVKNNKVYLRTLLYSTSKRGHLVESIYVSVKRNESHQNFNIWVYGEPELKRGSGLFVPQGGVTFDHHFLLPADGANFNFLAGNYQLTMYARIVGNKNKVELCELNLSITDKLAQEMLPEKSGCHFDWSPDQNRYYGHTVQC